MKKNMVLICIVILVIAFMCGCAQKGECDECGQYEELNKYVTNDGNVRYYCDTCHDMAKIFGE